MTAPDRIECDAYQLAARFVRDRLGDKFCDWNSHGICFCATCVASRGDQPTYERGLATACRLCTDNFSEDSAEWEQCGRSCRKYALPTGWCRFALKAGGVRAADIGAFDKWHVAFHGTNVEALEAILSSGALAKPGDEVVTGTQSRIKIDIRDGHLRRRFNRNNAHGKCNESFNPKQIFLSPTIRYCEKSLYAAPSHWTDDEDGRTCDVQVCLQVRVQPGSYSVGQETILGDDDTALIDDAYSNDEVEWYTPGAIGSIIITGLLVNVSNEVAAAGEAAEAATAAGTGATAAEGEGDGAVAGGCARERRGEAGIRGGKRKRAK